MVPVQLDILWKKADRSTAFFLSIFPRTISEEFFEEKHVEERSPLLRVSLTLIDIIGSKFFLLIFTFTEKYDYLLIKID